MNSTTTSTASDIRPNHWVLRLAPQGLRPYLRLARFDRPIGTWLLLFPGWWAIALGDAVTNSGPSWPLYLLFGVGALLMRGAGCVVNDILDRDFDAKVARTASRPIPGGEVSPLQAGLFLLALLLVSLAILLQMNGLTIALGCASLLLVFPYPLMKRITYWPQAWLGLTFNWGALLGWTAVTGSFGWPAALLYIGGIAWTLGYDTIYAHQDKEDDALIGVKSTALRLGKATKPWLRVFYALTLLLFGLAGQTAGLLWPFWLGLSAVALHFLWQVAALKMEVPGDCRAKFESNRFVGWLLLAGILAGSPWVHAWIGITS
ncbi:4-hydroxybenzoate octaprenyltransferase [Pelagibius litoralis]|uniref:4-hydroxybenzoate octaprenyltransferase n=1 Tax=Pelagibius litoralis TaxID=374515 RepID=A0A967F1G7_9PROT|nr:4-hydroxybenzoate octaprenyltransferase [Pelagibius litoralis]NIA71215.1 4-hydroxybenzoate octaprenyltransferase [Pelagibius litoralis]